jgi:DivIVA domain-containing protein
MDDRRTLSPNRHSGIDVTNANFRTVRKGFDPDEVRSFLEGIGREVALLEKRLQDVQSKLTDALHRAENPVLDEAQLAAALGSQSAAILRAAHDEAGRVTADAQERATQIFTQAQERATSYIVEAQARALSIMNEAEVQSQQKDEEARAASQRLEDSARINGEAIIDRSREQGRAVIEQANEARRQILNDLMVKRKALNVQIEQLRAARDVLTASVSSVRESVDQVLGGLMSSDEGARAAAIEALRHRPTGPEPTEEELLKDVPLRPVPEAPAVILEELAITNPTPPSRLPSVDKEAVKTRVNTPTLVPDAAPSSDVVGEIFARLRASTHEEKGREPTPAKRPTKVATTPVTPDDELFLQREASLAPHLSELVRHVKRALQDDQNVMIERLRGVHGMITDQMGDEADQRSRYVAAATESIRAAAQAGVIFSQTVAGVSGELTGSGAVEECATDLGITLALALRKRVQADGNDDGAERANAAYKEWRGARIERLCGDIARRAFNVGVIAACEGTQVRVVISPTDDPCDACKLDASSGIHLAGQNFPSGQPHPPLHAGCSCAVVPA